jgi:hypothetical protein
MLSQPSILVQKAIVVLGRACLQGLHDAWIASPTDVALTIMVHCHVVQGCEPVDFFCVNRDGRFSGEAFVVLGSEQQVEAALTQHKSSMGKRYVEVFRARKAVSMLWAAAGVCLL